MLLHLVFVLAATIGVCGHPNGQLPQLVNAAEGGGGGMSGGSGGGGANGGMHMGGGHGMEFSQQPQQYGNYYPQNAQQYRPDGQFFPQMAQEFRQGMNTMGEHLHNAGESLSNVPRNFFENAGHQISNTFEHAVESGMGKLRELQSHFSEKFRPLIDTAIGIFERPGTEKQHWNELVERIESTNLSEPEKQELYQKIANATAPQAHNPHGK